MVQESISSPPSSGGVSRAKRGPASPADGGLEIESRTKQLLHDGDGAVVVAVVAVRVVQVAFDKVVNVVAVGDGFMAATGAVDVLGIVAIASVGGGAVGRIGSGDVERVFIDMASVRVMQVTVVQVVDVVAVLDGGMPAVLAVLVVMLGVGLATHIQAPGSRRRFATEDTESTERNRAGEGSNPQLHAARLRRRADSKSRFPPLSFSVFSVSSVANGLGS
jgi:hypothetical protein